VPVPLNLAPPREPGPSLPAQPGARPAQAPACGHTNTAAAPPPATTKIAEAAAEAKMAAAAATTKMAAAAVAAKLAVPAEAPKAAAAAARGEDGGAEAAVLVDLVRESPGQEACVAQLLNRWYSSCPGARWPWRLLA
jgi:hypothetical protein